VAVDNLCDSAITCRYNPMMQSSKLSRCLSESWRLMRANAHQAELTGEEQLFFYD